MRLRFCIIPLLFLGIAACDNVQDREQKHFERGVSLFKEKDYARAQLEFKNAAKINPKNAMAFHYLGRIYENQKEWSRAYAAYGQAVSQLPDFADANLGLGRIEIIAGKFNDALGRAETVLASTSDNADAYALRAAALLKLKKLDAAKSDAERALSIDPDNGFAVAVLVGYFTQRKDVTGAVGILDRSLQRQPNNHPLRILKISLLLQRNQRQAAASEYRKLVASDPRNSGYVVGLVKLLIGLGRLDEGEDVLRKAIDVDPESVESRLRLVDFLANQRNPEIAQRTLLDYIEKSPDVREFRFALANLYRRSAKSDDAYKTLREVSESEGTSVPGLRAKLALANLSFIDGDAKSASELLGTVLKLEPGNSQALLLDARMAIAEKRYDRALADLRHVLRNDPLSRPALRLMSHTYLASGQTALAIDTLQRLLETYPSNQTRLELSQLMARRGEFGSSIKLVEDALAKNPHDLRAHATKVDILVMQGRLVAAQMAIQDIEPLAGSENVLFQLRGRIALAERRWADAEKLFREALKREPKSHKAALGLAQSLTGAGRTGDAALVLERAAKAFPQNIQIALRFAATLERLKRFEDAKNVYGRSIEYNPKSIAAHVRLSRLHAKLGETGKELDVLKRGVAENPSDLKLSLIYAMALQRGDRFEDAVAVYERLIKTSSPNMVLANNFGALVADHRSDDKDLLKRGLEYLSPHEGADNPHVADTIGWLHYRLGSVAQAITFLKRALATDPANPRFNYHIAVVYAADKRRDQARKHFEIALAEQRDSSLAEEIKRQMKTSLTQ